MTSFVNKNLPIYIDSELQITLIFGRYYKDNILSPNLSQKSKTFDIKLKNGTLFVRKANILLMTSSKHEKYLLG